MSDTYFEILRPGINSSIQDKGRNHLYHIGITISGAMDQRIFTLSNALVSNDLNEGAIEFAHQGPLLKLKNGNFSVNSDLFSLLSINKCVIPFLLSYSTPVQLFGYFSLSLLSLLEISLL